MSAYTTSQETCPVTVTTFTQCGPVEDHSWGNEVPIFYELT